MAVVNPEVNLAPSYALVQQALQQRANIAGQSGALNPLSTINAIAAPVAEQQKLASAQQFELDKIYQKSLLDRAEKTASAKPKVLVTPEGVDEFLDAYGIDEKEKPEYRDLLKDMIGKEVDEDEAEKTAAERIKFRESQKTRKEATAERVRLQEERQAALEEERAVKHDEKLREQVLEYSNKLQSNVVVKTTKQQGLNMTAMDKLAKAAEEGNTIAMASLGIKAARAMGEVGVITDQDVKRYITSAAMARGILDKLKLAAVGKPTDWTLEEIKAMAPMMRDVFKREVQEEYNDYTRRLAINYKMPTSEAATRLQVDYTGNKIVRAKKKDGTPILLELSKDGKPIQEINFDSKN